MNKRAETPFSGVRVVELANNLGAEQAGHLLAELGASVTKLEPESGAQSRMIGPFVAGRDDPDHSLTFWYYNSRKTSRTFAVDCLAETLGQSLENVDVLVVGLQPGELSELGLDLNALRQAHPRLVITSITPYGLTGPWSDFRATDLTTLATSGILITSGYDDHTIPPIRPGGDQSYNVGAIYGHIATQLALIERERSGEGALLDIALHDALAVTVELANPYWFYPRALVQRQTCRHAQPTPTQPALFRCADDRFVYFALILADPKPWESLVAWMQERGLAADLTDAAYSDLAHRQASFQHIQTLVECFFLLQDATTAYHDGQAYGLPIGILNAPEDLLEDEHLKEREFFEAIDIDGLTVTFPGAPYRFSAFGTAPRRPAPRLGST